MSQPYAPRDVANATAIRQAIDQRSQQRGDPPEVRQWLLNHFWRHVIGNLQAPPLEIFALHSLQQAEPLFAPQPVPEWVQAKLKSQPRQSLAPDPPAHQGADACAGALWWIAADGPTVLATEQRLLEFLHTRQGTALQGKLMRINCPQALALWQAEHDRMLARLQNGLHSHQPEAVQLLWQGQGGAFYELRPHSAHLRSEMAYESQHMHHCLGQFQNRRKLHGGYGEHYASACEQGQLRLFSYRSGQQQPHITLSAWTLPDGRLRLDQIKGKQNRPPVRKYVPEVQAFLNTLPFIGSDEENGSHPDALALRLVHVPSGWRRMEEIRSEADQLALLAHHPDLLAQQSIESPLLLWLLAARVPQALQGRALPAALAQALKEGGHAC